MRKGTVLQSQEEVTKVFLSDPFPDLDLGSEYHEKDNESDDLDSGANSSSNVDNMESASDIALIDEVEDLQTPQIMNNHTVDDILDSFYQ